MNRRRIFESELIYILRSNFVYANERFFYSFAKDSARIAFNCYVEGYYCATINRDNFDSLAIQLFEHRVKNWNFLFPERMNGNEE